MIRPRMLSMRTLRPVAVLCLAVVIAAPAALAQGGRGGSGGGSNKAKEEQLQPPTPPIGKADIPWYPYLGAILLLVVVVAVNFIPSKRGHQD